MDTHRPVEADRAVSPWADSGHDLDPAPRLPVAPRDEAAEVARREAEWNSSLRPCTAFDLWLVGRIAVESIRLERHDAHERALLDEASLRAGEGWDEDRALEAVELAAGLRRDPARTAAHLRQTKQGCEWLAARLAALEARMRRRGDADADDRARALDLLGVPPDERDDADADSAGPDALRRRVAELEAYRDRVLVPRDARDRERALLGLGPASAELRRARREARSCARRLEWARVQVARHGGPPARVAAPRPRHEAPVAAPTGPAAAPRPARLDPFEAVAKHFGIRVEPPADAVEPPVNRHERRRREALERHTRP